MSELSMRQRQRAERILAVAGDLIAHFGYDKTTMDDIAREADVSKGALYLHFTGKEDLFDALMQRETDLVQDAVLARLEAEGDELNIFTLYRASIEIAQARPLLRALLTGNRRIMGDYVQRIRQASQSAEMLGFNSEFVVHMQQAGIIRADVHPDALAALLRIVTIGFLSMPDLIQNAPQPELVGEALADMLQRAYGTEFGNSEAGRAAVRDMFEHAKEFMAQMRAQTGRPRAVP